MSTVKSKKLQVGTDASASNNFTIYQPSTPDGTLRVGNGTADSPTEVGRFDSNGYIATNAPCFSAEASSDQTVSNSVWTKMAANSTFWDLTNDYDTTNYRFTPSVKGYYQVNCHTRATATSITQHNAQLYKNGSIYRQFYLNRDAATAEGNGTMLVYCNGTTDYLETYLLMIGTGTLTFQYLAPGGSWWEASLVRAT